MYVGWLRQFGKCTGKRSPWRPVCEAAGYDECWERLQQTPRSGACEMVVLPGNSHPDRALPRAPIAPSPDKARRHRGRRK
jgi:hypothetical protein